MRSQIGAYSASVAMHIATAGIALFILLPKCGLY
jgi:hypothetical protein